MDLSSQVILAASEAGLRSRSPRERTDASVARIPEYLEWLKDGKSEDEVLFRIAALKIVQETCPALFRPPNVIELAEMIVKSRFPKTRPAPETTVTRKKAASKKGVRRKKTVG
jgi:hypothetical protein